MNIFSRPRYDCFVLWGHGQAYADNVLEEIRQSESFSVVHIERHRVKNIKRLVNRIYSFDYAPLFHLKSKIRYLRSTPPIVLFIFVYNPDPLEDMFGEGDFRHVESLRIKAFKDSLRARFNPMDEHGRMTHNHIIHATDNESQTDSILRLLGYRDGVRKFASKKKVFSSPHYIQEPDQLSVRVLPYEALICANAWSHSGKVSLKKVGVKESVQFKGLSDPEIYRQYVSEHRGTVLKQDYNVERYFRLKEDFSYLAEGHETDFVIVTNDSESDKYLILDGLHRAALHIFQGNEMIKVCVI